MTDSISNVYSDVTKDPRFLAFSRLATENYGGNQVSEANRYSMSFQDYCEKLEKGEVVEPKNTLNNYTKANWESRVERAFEKSDSALGNEVMNIIKKSYRLGLVDENHTLLRYKAIEAYKNSI